MIRSSNKKVEHTSTYHKFKNLDWFPLAPFWIRIIQVRSSSLITSNYISLKLTYNFRNFKKPSLGINYGQRTLCLRKLCIPKWNKICSYCAPEKSHGSEIQKGPVGTMRINWQNGGWPGEILSQARLVCWSFNHLSPDQFLPVNWKWYPQLPVFT